MTFSFAVGCMKVSSSFSIAWPLEQLLNLIFERLDNNSDGLITREELKLLKQSKLITSNITAGKDRRNKAVENERSRRIASSEKPAQLKGRSVTRSTSSSRSTIR